MSRRGKSATGELEDAIKEQEQDLSAKGREIRGLSEQARLAQIDIDMKEEVRLCACHLHPECRVRA